MQAITKGSLNIDGNGIIQVPQPSPKPGELLIEIAASGVNRLDLNRLAHGTNDLILGVEVAGIVLENHSTNPRFIAGTRVYGIVRDGGYAQQVCLPADQALIMPASMNYVEAAAIAENYLTGYQALIWLANLQEGETVLVHAGASGVGLAAIQLAKSLKHAKVIATASLGKHAACYAAGADLVIDYQTTDFSAAVLAFDPHGADVILDFIGAAYFHQNLKCAAIDGRHILISTLSGSQVDHFDLRQIADKRLSLIGTLLSPRSDTYKAQLVQAFATATTLLFADGQLKPVIDSTFDFANTKAALEYMAANQNIGKIVLTH